MKLLPYSDIDSDDRKFGWGSVSVGFSYIS